jgi:LysR family cyn operon transcriptional activator
MNVNQLRYFIAIVENRSFRSASEVLNVSQPALSNSIKTLEELLQVQLFERGKHGVLPTAYGKVLYQFFKSAVQTIERGSREVESMRDGSKGHLNIGAPTGMIDLFLPRIVRRQSIWDKRADDLRESLAHLGFQFRRRFCGVASAVV